jgi:hypothetical protein
MQTIIKILDALMDAYLDEDVKECPNMDANEDTCYGQDKPLEDCCASCRPLTLFSLLRQSLS